MYRGVGQRKLGSGGGHINGIYINWTTGKEGPRQKSKLSTDLEKGGRKQ